MPSLSKDTIYVDIDDEITAIIDKLKSSDKKIVALVLPKRAGVLQSIVNMKLLKRTADDAKKSLVLITSEVGVLPLAGAVGVHVAKTLQSKPAIPLVPSIMDDTLSVDGDEIDDVEVDPTKSVGELTDDDPIEVDNDDKPEVAAGAGVVAASAAKKKKIKIPNFDKFRLKIILGVLALVLIIVGLFVATQVLPKARVVIKTDSSTIDSELKLTVSPKAATVNEEGTVVPGIQKEIKKTDTESVPATGQIDKGEKATGTVRIYNCNQSDKLGDVSRTVPAGTELRASNLVFITTESVTVDPSGFTGSACKFDKPSAAVKVLAQAGGDKYNLAARSDHSYSVAGYSSMSADGSAMAGGTTVITKVVAQKDIDDARQKIQDRGDAARDSLLGDMEAEGTIGLRETFATKGEPVITATPKVNEAGDKVTVSIVSTYTLLGVKKEDLKLLVEKSVEGKYDKSKQVILDNGLDKVRVVLDEKKPNGDAIVTIRAQVLAGPQLDENAIKSEIAGKKKNPGLTAIKARPGIEDAQITYSPFWVSVTPKKTSKITVIFEQSNTDDN